MSYTNSSLVNVTRISPNRSSPRNHAIDTITIHCVVGQASPESLGTWFAQSSKRASSNYGIGPDGRVGMYVEEKDRSWCSSSPPNDNRAVTIETASDTTHPYAVTTAAYEGVIRLVADICKRNGIKELKWQGDKSLIGQTDRQNMTVHRWFASKECPGDYLYNRMGDIAKRVNDILDGSCHPTLRQGFVGDDVKDMQKRLISLGFGCGDAGADGDFGPATLAAVKAFQTDRGLMDVDGVAGPSTWYALDHADEPEKKDEDESTDGGYLVRVSGDLTVYQSFPEPVGTCATGVYTIVEEKEGYGKLKSGAGWIALSGTKKV